MAETKPRVAADEDDSEGPITDVLLAKISSNLGQEYFTLGIMLKVPRPYMNRIDGDYVGNMIRKSFEVLDKWRTMSYKDGTTVTVMIEQLIKALADVDRADVGDLVRREVFPPDRIQRPEVTCDETDYGSWPNNFPLASLKTEINIRLLLFSQEPKNLDECDITSPSCISYSIIIRKNICDY